MSNRTYDGPQSRVANRHAAARPRLRLLWWVRKYDLDREEWEATKACAEQIVRYREWLVDRYEDEGTDEPKPESADDVLSRECEVQPGSLRESQLAQVAMEVAWHMGARLSDYKWRSRKARHAREAA